ncbi:hypothetical protein [Trichlorobacter lovleyi]|uniref:hypothetical protein n=1 Tax=Trichlorobacter lovleyi TaxID=313985 RepID=UPI003D124E6E
MARTKIECENYSQRRTELSKQHKAAAFDSLKHKIDAFGDDAQLNEYETAEYLSKSVQSLRNDRINGGKIPYQKIGGSVRYRFGAVKLAA